MSVVLPKNPSDSWIKTMALSDFFGWKSGELMVDPHISLEKV